MNDYLYVFTPMREFLFSVNVHVFILMVLFTIKKCGFYLVLMHMHLFL